jgi:hypothetical protein
MRLALIGLAVVAAALAANVRPSSAQFNNRYCSEGGAQGSSGDRDCSFYTMAQCREAARGLNKSCIENPSLQWERRGSRNSYDSSGNDRRRGY